MPRPADPFRCDETLKRDTFGAIERGVFVTADAATADGATAAVESVPCVRRNVACAPFVFRGVARWLAWREVRALNRLDEARIGLPSQGLVPRVLDRSRIGTVRSWVEGLPMHLGEPRHREYYRVARRLLRDLRRAGVIHVDTAKEPNWLVTPEGRPALVDFQLAVVFRLRDGAVRGLRGRVFRAMALEDLRHLLKHKRTYCPEALTMRERGILSRPSRVSRVWRATFKKAYNWLTRRVFDWSDREGVGRRR